MSALMQTIKDTFGENLNEHTKRLFEIQAEIESLEAQISALRANAKTVAFEGVVDFSGDERAVSSLYWVGSMLGCAGIVKDTYRAAIGKQLTVSSLVGTSECRHCGEDIHTEISSASRLEQWLSGSMVQLVCSVCDAKSKQRTAAEERQSELRKAHLSRMPYKEYLKTPEWAARRARALRTAKGACQLCNATGVVLDVHHRTYKNRGNEKFADLIVLCRACHGKHHGKGGEV